MLLTYFNIYLNDNRTNYFINVSIVLKYTLLTSIMHCTCTIWGATRCLSYVTPCLTGIWLNSLTPLEDYITKAELYLSRNRIFPLHSGTIYSFKVIIFLYIRVQCDLSEMKTIGNIKNCVCCKDDSLFFLERLISYITDLTEKPIFVFLGRLWL